MLREEIVFLQVVIRDRFIHPTILHQKIDQKRARLDILKVLKLVAFWNVWNEILELM